MFTDCIVRNRGAIVEPWHEFRTEGNRYFGFLFARGDTPAAVEHALRTAHARLAIAID